MIEGSVVAAAGLAAAGAVASVARADEDIPEMFKYDIAPGQKVAEPPSGDPMKNVLVIVASPTIGGNGDALGEAVCAELEDVANVECLHLRDLHIGQVTQHGDVPPVSDITTDHDAMDIVIPAIHKAEGIVLVCPTIYNIADPRTLTMISRLWQPTWSNADYQLGPEKRVGALLTCTGSNEEWLKLFVQSYVTLPDIECSVSDYRTEVFRACYTPSTCANDPDALERARDVARWVIE